MDTIEQLLQRGQLEQGAGEVQTLLSAAEAERIIEQLAPLPIEEVGSGKWHIQHEWIERLNLQAHYNAQTHSDEFVVELLVSLDKLHVVVHDLLLIEAWKEFVYPLLMGHLADNVDSVTSYMLLYHEVTVASLLQVVLYHSHAVEALSEDYALELADWCYRKLTRLNSDGHKLAQAKDLTAEERLSMSRVEELEEKRGEIEFGVMMCSLAILRYITDGLPRMPMGALSRVVSTNDTLMGLLPLLDRPPWVRTRVPSAGASGGKGGRPVLEKWGGNGWVAVPPADRLKITQTHGQVWLAVTNLLVEPRCRAKYGMDEFRRERILGLRRHLNELMFDQLPVLKDLQRVLDELALGVLPDQSGAGKAAALILEAVPVVRDAMLRGRNWRAVADQAKKEHFGKEAAWTARERLEAMMKHLDFLCELEPKPQEGAAADGAPGTDAQAPPPPVKVSTWRKVHDGGVYEPWYDFVMEVDESKPPEPVEVAADKVGPSGGGSSKGTKAGGGDVAAVHGLRYRLRPLDVDSTRPLPANGKAVVRWGDLAAEALIQLPELPTRSSEEGAAALWVTVGLLAVDGLVLQVKLKKAPKPKERDRVAGVWYAYHPVAGALTVLRDGATAAPAAAASCVASGPQALGGSKAQIAAKSGSNGRPLVQVVSEPMPAKVATKSIAALSPPPSMSSSSTKTVQSGYGDSVSAGGTSSGQLTETHVAAPATSADRGERVTRGSVATTVSPNTAMSHLVEAPKAATAPAATSPAESQNTSCRMETGGANEATEDRGMRDGMAAGGQFESKKPEVEAAATQNPTALTTVPVLHPPVVVEASAAAAEEEEVVGLDDPE